MKMKKNNFLITPLVFILCGIIFLAAGMFFGERTLTIMGAVWIPTGILALILVLFALKREK